MTETSRDVMFHQAAVADIAPADLYRILWLRVQVFVVEQAAAYEELDGRDIETGAVLLWCTDGDDVLATLRLLDDGDAWRIGRVATAASARGRGLAAQLMDAAIATAAAKDAGRPFVLDAQLHLADWYGRFGFVVDGPEFVEDNIPHVPMRRG
ncbi:GNAT family N-acetyltransferase [Microbacterium dauci]|uniref:GNAT family N-acetyltransferase n=1 Tax=Microbacterium dauci TaxID=3048008 RepID=A0ABT6ZH28_9MICO|nr:GNAT family N-acetyltransferase [Microbacterium sp. LX3-4]MDJ1115444.1 GNAT family N-acetyltransferase [Microbacterium sp. LX3-4]